MIEDEGFEPNPRIHRPKMFICLGDGCEMGYGEAPENVIASGLLEEIGEWYSALKEVQHTNVPAAVAQALAELHDAACGWVDWLEKRDTARAQAVASPLPPKPLPPVRPKLSAVRDESS